MNDNCPVDCIHCSMERVEESQARADFEDDNDFDDDLDIDDELGF